MKNSETNNIQSHSGNTVLCDGFFIPMTDFVLQIDKLRPCDLGQDFSSWNLSKLITIKNYAKFIKQPLKLEMFVPCDDEGNILEEPQMIERKVAFDEVDYDYNEEEVIVYKKAKEKVLFEGFEPYEDYECAKYEDVYIDEEVCDGKFTVEDLIKDTGKTKIKLSQTTLIAIFG